MKDGRISGYFATKHSTSMTVPQTEQNLHNVEDQIIANFFSLKQVNFRVTPIKVSWSGTRGVGNFHIFSYIFIFIWDIWNKVYYLLSSYTVQKALGEHSD